MRDLFSTGVFVKEISTDDRNLETGNFRETMSRETIKMQIKNIVNGENRKKPYSDEQLVEQLNAAGISISRRTVAKYRMEMGIGGVFQRRE